jgi:hypothetical protein
MIENQVQRSIPTSKRVILIFVITLLLLSVTSCDLMLNLTAGFLDDDGHVVSEVPVIGMTDNPMDDRWIYTPSESAIDTVKDALANQAKKDYTNHLEIKAVWVSDEVTDDYREQYAGSELATSRGLSKKDVEENLLVVLATYDVEYDHEKTFMDDGEITTLFIMNHDVKTGLWYVFDTQHLPSPHN